MGLCETRKILDGLGNIDDKPARTAGDTYRAVTLPPTTRSAAMSIWWWTAAIRPPRPSYDRGFEISVGTFYANDNLKAARPGAFLWTMPATDRPRWEQAFSADDGATWKQLDHGFTRDDESRFFKVRQMTMSLGKFVLVALIVTAICFVSDGFLHRAHSDRGWNCPPSSASRSGPCRLEDGYFTFSRPDADSSRVRLRIAPPRLEQAQRPPPLLVVAWVTYSLTGPRSHPLGFFSESLWISAALYQLVFSIVAAIAGAAPYSGKEAAH